jgi:RimJ/RimL family protein N-acetyltransferase
LDEASHVTARIRPLQGSEGPEWQRLFASVAAEGLWIGAETPVPDLGQEMVQRFVGSSTEIMFLALVDDEAVGWVSGETEEDGRIELGMGIVDGYRGRGIGSALMESVIAWAGERTLILRVFPHNERARALYRKFGFVELEHKVGVWPRRNGEFWDLIFMERSLPPI